MKKINVAKLLKDCPQNMELDCTMFNKVTLFTVDDREGVVFPITVFREDGNPIVLTKYGQYTDADFAKCIIFPKGKTTWEGFVPPCQFKDGDIVALDTEKGAQLFIFKENIYNYDYVQCYMMLDCGGEIDFEIGDYYVERFATEEEKAKLFQAIKDNGYEWNAETKTLEKLNIPKEEPIEDKGNISDGYHTFNELYEYRLLYNASMFNELAKQGLYDVHKSKKHSDGTIPFGDENWFIVQAELPTGQISNHYEMKDWDLFQVPVKEKANLYDGHTPQDVAKRLRMFLTSDKLIEPKFKVGDKVRHKNNHNVVFTITSIEEDSYVCGTTLALWFDDQDQYELVPNKFNINTLVPFESRVLVRYNKEAKWCPAIWGFYDYEKGLPHRYAIVGGITFAYCIPYEGNEHLLGKTEDCKDFYKTW